MNRNVEPRFASALVRAARDLGDRLVLASERHAEGRHDADRVLVAALDDFLGRHAEAAALERDLTQFHVEVASELMPAYLHRPGIIFGRSVGLPGLPRFSRHFHFNANPPSMQASLLPVVEQPMVSAASGEFQRSARMCTQRFSISAVAGYSSLSMMFLSMQDPSARGPRIEPSLAEGREVLASVAVQKQLVSDEGPRRHPIAVRLGQA